ncbi:MAG: hypothetical protein AB8B60_00715 [Sulfitobacter sp.]
MISVSHLYSDLSAFKAADSAIPQMLDEEVEDAKLSSFEAGYQAGWEDAIKAQDHEETKLTADFVQHLQDLSFTYQEAYAKLTAGMQPLIMRMIKTVLPEAIHQGLGVQLVNQINGLLDAQSENVIELAVAPEKYASVDALLKEHMTIPFAITQEQSLSAGQVYLRVNKAEREINLDAVLVEVTQAVDAFFYAVTPETEHG